MKPHILIVLIISVLASAPCAMSKRFFSNTPEKEIVSAVKLDGYKDAKWGMTPDQVSAILPIDEYNLQCESWGSDGYLDRGNPGELRSLLVLDDSAWTSLEESDPTDYSVKRGKYVDGIEGDPIFLFYKKRFYLYTFDVQKGDIDEIKNILIAKYGKQNQFEKDLVSYYAPYMLETHRIHTVNKWICGNTLVFLYYTYNRGYSSYGTLVYCDKNFTDQLAIKKHEMEVKAYEWSLKREAERKSQALEKIK